LSSGHHHKTDLTDHELDDLLDEVLADPRVKRQLAKPRKVNTSKDIPLLGSSNIGWTTIYLDVHLRVRDLPYGTILVDGKRLDVKPGLIRHETLEPILENLFGWPYSPPSHEVAQHWEERDYIDKGFDPRAVEKTFKPFIRNDESEPLPNVPLDLDLRPEAWEPKLLERVKLSQDKQKRTHLSVGYTSASKFQTKSCSLCQMFIENRYGGPGCTFVKNPISPKGLCRRFSRGSLVNPNP
jgi:hypothetical protein